MERRQSGRIDRQENHTYKSKHDIMRYEAKFTPTVEDALAGYRMVNRQPNDLLKLCAIGGILAVVIFSIASYILHTWILAIGGVWIGIFTFSIVWLMEFRIRRAAKKSRPEEIKANFTDEGIEVSDNISQNKCPWGEIKKIILDERGVLISIDLTDHSGFVSFFIPARAFVGGYYPLKELKLLMKQKNIP
jgi:hypothetical protein